MQTPTSVGVSRRAYQCVRCKAMGVATIDRRDRLVHHVLKYHVPLDEAPHYCRLCMFRCMQEAQLNQHVSSYQKHVKLAKEHQILDHKPYLCSSARPKVMTEQDITVLSKEESKLWFGQRRRGSSSAPEAAFDSDSEPEYSATPLTPPRASAFVQKQPAATSVVQTGPLGIRQNYEARPQPVRAPWVVIKPTRGLQVPAPTLEIPSLDHLIWSPEVGTTAPTTTDEMPLSMPVIETMPQQASVPILNTPLLDERCTPAENIMEQLLPGNDLTDPLAIEASAVSQAEKSRIRDKSEGNSPAPTKKPRKEEPQEKEAANVDFSSVVKAFTDATAAIVAAIDRNSRAIRCQGAALDSLVKEMREVNHQLRTKQRRAASCSSPSPVVKSVVHRPRK